MLDSKPVNPLEVPSRKEVKISRLLNSIQFYLECAFIAKEVKGCRLIIIHNGRVYMNTYYNTLRGAKIAFTKYFGRRAYQDDVKPAWSHDYRPDDVWIDQQFEIIKKSGVPEVFAEV